MALELSSGISCFLFVLLVPRGFCTITGETEVSDYHVGSLQTRHEGTLPLRPLTALNAHENTSRRFIEGFPLENGEDGLLARHSMQISRKSRTTRSLPGDRHRKVHKGSGVIARLPSDQEEMEVNHFTEVAPARHQNSVRKRAAISPPLLFLSILMDYSGDEEDGGQSNSSRNSSSNKRRRPHRSFRTSSFGHHEEVGQEQPPDANSSGSGGGFGNATRLSSVDASPPSQIGVITSSSPPLCPIGHFECTNNPSHCVPQSAICNGKPECPDGSDEYKCVNIHEKKFWDSFFQKRPAADIARGNSTCLYNADPKTERRNEWGTEEEMGEFHELLAKGLCRCSLEKVVCHNMHLANLHAFPNDIQFLDLSGCRIDKLEFPSGRFAEMKTLVLSSCSIREITSETFSFLPNLKVLHLTGNHLKRVPATTFSGNGNLSKLFLGHNQIEMLDSESFSGLHSLEYLDLRKNRLTGEESKVFQTLTSLRTLHLSFNEIRRVSVDLLSGLTQLEMLSLTKNKISIIDDGALNHFPLLKHLYLSYNRLSVLENSMFCSLQDLLNLNLNDNGIVRIEPLAFECLDSLQSLILEKNPFRELSEDDDKDPRQLFVNLTSLQHIYFDEWWMCWWAPHVRSCEPKGDGISSVDNLLDNVILRVCVWIMGAVGVGGNLFVIVSRLVIREKNKAHSFYIKNLAVADLIMGLFLISIAFHDVSFRGHFLAHQQAWRHSITCQVSGMLSTLSSEASVFILFLITLDRYLSIVRPFAERRSALIPAILIVAVFWSVAILLSYAPLCPWFRGYFGKSFYSSNGLCLPLHIHNPYETGWEYSLFLFIAINSVAFIFICFAYWRMLRIIQTSTTSIRSTQQKQDGMLVKRFGLVVVTDFLCWAPIIIIKCIAMAGVEIQSDLYAWLAVFVLPVNSALNPVIYTLSTKLFKQQVSHITVGFRKRLGLATDESTTSSLLYRNRISRTLQTSLSSSMMRSTRRYGGNGESSRVTVIKDRMAMSNRTAKVSNCSPPSGHAPAVSTVTTIATPGGGHIIPNGGPTTFREKEINGQIVQQLKVDEIGSEVMAESEL